MKQYQIHYLDPKGRLIYADAMEGHDFEDLLHRYFMGFDQSNFKVTPILIKRKLPALRIEQLRPGQEYWEVFDIQLYRELIRR